MGCKGGGKGKGKGKGKRFLALALLALGCGTASNRPNPCSPEAYEAETRLCEALIMTAPTYEEAQAEFAVCIARAERCS